VSDVEIRVLHQIAEYEDTLPVQEAVWGFADIDKVPSRLMMVATKVGGLVLGLYEGETMSGFAFALPGRKPDGSSYLHSHMTAVLPDAQNRGLGRRLKLRQREEALRLGYRLIEWTFDPLEIRNAFFNFERLGVIAGRYEPNIYGATSSHLHGRIPTDRLVAEWHLASERARAIADRSEPVEKLEKRVHHCVDVPARAAELRNSDPETAAALQAEVREKLQKAFQEGFQVIGFRRTDSGGAFELGS